MLLEADADLSLASLVEIRKLIGLEVPPLYRRGRLLAVLRHAHNVAGTLGGGMGWRYITVMISVGSNAYCFLQCGFGLIH